jgi:hypothetical protein
MRRIDEEQAKLHDLQAQRDDEWGDELGAAWHRVAAVSLRTRTPEAKAVEDRTWLVMMATMHVKNGTVPEEGSHRAAEIEEAMDAIRDAALLADRPSHSTVSPEAAVTATTNPGA